MTDYAKRLQSLSNQKLMDVVKNYRQYGYDEAMRLSAISILESRGITRQQLELTGNFENHTYDIAMGLYKAFSRNSNIAFYLYLMILVSNVFIPVLSKSWELMSHMLLILVFLLVLGYVVFLIKSFLNQHQFYKIIKQPYSSEVVLIYVLLGMPFYVFMYFYFRKQMKEKMKAIR